jgi:Zn-dependent protease with chaperone function
MATRGPVTTMLPTAFDEASRQTYGRLYWVVTAVLVVATVAAWVWGERWAQVTVGVVALAFILVVGVVNHRRMNRIARDRARRADAGGAGAGASPAAGDDPESA